MAIQSKQVTSSQVPWGCSYRPSYAGCQRIYDAVGTHPPRCCGDGIVVHHTRVVKAFMAPSQRALRVHNSIRAVSPRMTPAVESHNCIYNECSCYVSHVKKFRRNGCSCFETSIASISLFFCLEKPAHYGTKAEKSGLKHLNGV